MTSHNFYTDNPDYPQTIASNEIEYCFVSDTDIPAGSGGINREQYTYGQLRHCPIIPELYQHLTYPILRKWAEECNQRNATKGFVMYKVKGEYCFWGLRLGPVIAAPNVYELSAILSQNPKTVEALRRKTVDAQMIRAINYQLLRKTIADQMQITEQKAGLLIGNQFDAVPHEDESGYIYMVPNWAHSWFRHDGYVSKMLKIINQ